MSLGIEGRHVGAVGQARDSTLKKLVLLQYFIPAIIYFFVGARAPLWAPFSKESLLMLFPNYIIFIVPHLACCIFIPGRRVWARTFSLVACNIGLASIVAVFEFYKGDHSLSWLFYWPVQCIFIFLGLAVGWLVESIKKRQ